MISDRTTNSLLATLLSVPPIFLVAAVVHKILPPAPALPAVVAANDRQIDAWTVRPKTLHREKRGNTNRPLAYRYDSDAR